MYLANLVSALISAQMLNFEVNNLQIKLTSLTSWAFHQSANLFSLNFGSTLLVNKLKAIWFRFISIWTHNPGSKDGHQQNALELVLKQSWQSHFGLSPPVDQAQEWSHQYVHLQIFIYVSSKESPLTKIYRRSTTKCSGVQMWRVGSVTNNISPTWQTSRKKSPVWNMGLVPIGQSGDDVAKSREGLVDVLCFL